MAATKSPDKTGGEADAYAHLSETALAKWMNIKQLEVCEGSVFSSGCRFGSSPVFCRKRLRARSHRPYAAPMTAGRATHRLQLQKLESYCW